MKVLYRPRILYPFAGILMITPAGALAAGPRTDIVGFTLAVPLIGTDFFFAEKV